MSVTGPTGNGELAWEIPMTWWSGSTIDTATWYHMALSWDGSEVTGYLNGALDFGPTPYFELDTVREIYIMTWMPNLRIGQGKAG